MRKKIAGLPNLHVSPRKPTMPHPQCSISEQATYGTVPGRDPGRAAPCPALGIPSGSLFPYFSNTMTRLSSSRLPEGRIGIEVRPAVHLTFSQSSTGSASNASPVLNCQVTISTPRSRWIRSI